MSLIYPPSEYYNYERWYTIHPHQAYLGGGDRGRETGRKGGWRCTGGGRRGGEKRDSQGGGKREKKGKIMQHCTIFWNRKNAKRREPKNTGREPGLKGTGSGRFKPPCPPLYLCSLMSYISWYSPFPLTMSSNQNKSIVKKQLYPGSIFPKVCHQKGQIATLQPWNVAPQHRSCCYVSISVRIVKWDENSEMKLAYLHAYICAQRSAVECRHLISCARSSKYCRFKVKLNKLVFKTSFSVSRNVL